MQTSNYVHSRKGFTLIEMIGVIVIIGLVASITLPKIFEILQDARVQNVEGNLRTVRNALANYMKAPDAPGYIPITEGSGIRTTGTSLTAATDTVKSNAATLDTILLTANVIERPLSVKMGTQNSAPSGTSPRLTWDLTTQSFIMSPDGTPDTDWSRIARIEARLANTALAPEVAQGANFQLNGISSTVANNTTVVYAVIPDIPASDAHQLALSMNGGQLTSPVGTANASGPVVYNTPTDGVTDVYIFITSI